MAFVAGTFVLVFGIIAGLYWLFVEAPDVKDEHAVRQRLKKAVTPGRLTKAIAKERERLSDVGFIDALLARSGRLIQPLQLTIAQSGLKVTVSVVLLSCLVAGATVFALVTVYLNLPLL